MKHDRPYVLPALESSVATRLRAVASRLRRYVLLEGCAWVVGFLLLAAFVQLSLDYGFRGLQWSMRLSLLAIIAAAAVWLAWRKLLGPLRVPVSATDVAHLVERRYHWLSSLLVSAVRFTRGDVGAPDSNSPALMASVISRAGAAVQSADFTVVLEPRRARVSLFALSLALTGGVLAVMLRPDIAHLWFARNVLLQDIAWPRRTHLVVDIKDGVLFGARGDDVVVHAFAEGVQPREVELFFETLSGQAGRETMVTVGNPGSYRYRYTFKNAQENLMFHVRGGDDRTSTYEVRLVERPRVVESRLTLVPPRYTQLQPLVLGGPGASGYPGGAGRAAQVLPGTAATIWIKTNKPVVQATLMAGEDKVGAACAEVEGYRADVLPHETQTYTFALVDDVGLEDKAPAKFSLRMIKDEPPSARMKLAGVGDMITPEAVLPFTLEYADTYGIAIAELAYEVSREGFAEKLIPLPDFTPHSPTFTSSVSWPVAAGGVAAGERLTLRARATDFDDVSGPNTSESPAVTLRVVTRDELLAELARREQEGRMDFERLVDAQEQLRGALLTVWDQSRRSGNTTETLVAALAPLERRQRTLSGSVNVIRQQFERILEELHVNQLDTADERERLGAGIIDPLARLTRRDLSQVADAMRQWAREGSADAGAGIDPQQVAILSQMRAVLASMIQWEGYQEVVTLLRDIVRLQNELKVETRDAQQSEGGDVFDD